MRTDFASERRRGGEGATSPTGATGFVGRGPELGILRAAFRDACESRGRCVLIGGQAGVGKTRLAEILCAEARQQGARVWWGRCYEGQGAPAFWPWVQILREAARTLPTKLRARHLHPGAGDLAALLAEAAPVRDHAAYSPQRRFRLLDAFVDFLRDVTRDGVVVLVLDDLHAADPASLDLAQFVVREQRSLPILLIATHHDTTTDAAALSAATAEMERSLGTESFRLSGWDEGEVAEYVERTIGTAPRPDLVRLLRDRTEGNPLFVGEFLRALLAAGGADAEGSAELLKQLLPQGVRAVVGRRLGCLSPACLETATLAAVLGREFHGSQIELLTNGLGAGDALREAIDAGLITPLPQDEEGFCFTHGLVRDTLYEGLAPDARCDLHLRIAQALEAVRDGDRLSEVAYHYCRAGSLVPATKTVDSLCAAAEEAAAALAYEEAARLYGVALKVVEREEQTEQRSDGVGFQRMRYDLLMALGRCQNTAIDRSEAERTFRRACEVSRSIAAALGWTVAAPLLGRAALGFAGQTEGVVEVVRLAAPQPALFAAELVNLLEEALAVLPADQASLRARLLARLAVELYFVAPPERREEMSSEAVALAERSGDTHALAYALSLRHVAIWASNNTSERVALAGEIVRLAEAGGETELLGAARGWRLLGFLELGDESAMERELALFSNLAESTRHPQLLWSVALHRAMRSLIVGRLEDSERLALEARRLGRHEKTTAFTYLNLQLAALRREQGRLAEMEGLVTFLRAAVDMYPAVPSLRTQLAYLYAESGRTAEARSELECLASTGFHTFPMNLTWLYALAEAAEVCASLGDGDKARLLYDLLLPYATRTVISVGGTTCLGSAARILGRLAMAMGDWAAAEAHFEGALAANRRLGAVLWVAHTQVSFASMRLTRGLAADRGAATHLLRQAKATADVLGLACVGARIRDVERAFTRGSEEPREVTSGGRTSAATRREASDDAGKVASLHQEGDYWSLNFDGRTCRLRDSKGLRCLAMLLGHPGQRFHVLELATMGEGLPTANASTGIENVGRAAQAGIPLLDAVAKAAYKSRLDELRSELAEAEAYNDFGRAARARSETDRIESELAASLGFGGRGRSAGGHAERARSTVAKRIHLTVQKLRDSNPALGRYLDKTIRTGFFCAYEPAEESEARWSIRVTL